MTAVIPIDATNKKQFGSMELSESKCGKFTLSCLDIRIHLLQMTEHYGRGDLPKSLQKTSNPVLLIPLYTIDVSADQ